MSVVYHYLDDPLLKGFYGTMAELLAMDNVGRMTGDRFFAYDVYLSYRYSAGDRGWLLWELHGVT